MEDQAIEIVGDIGEREFGLGAGHADGADEQPEPVLLMGEDMFNPGADRRLCRIGPCDILRHRLARRLAAVNAADQHLGGQPLFVLL